MEMKLGWVILRNPGQMEMQDGNPDRGNLEEKLRSQHPWSTVPRDRFGITALRIHLRETVTANARRAFPSVIYLIPQNMDVELTE
jgi:hypothetical protein